MKRVTQSRVGEDGTCFRAALASILEIPEADVPDFPDANHDPGVNKFLRKHGLRYTRRPIDSAKPSGWHVIEGISPRGGMHAVVGHDGVFKHDPHPQDGTGRGLVEPMFWGALEPIEKSVRANDMPMNPHAFCKAELASTMIDVRKVFTPAEIKAAWVWEGARKSFAFHGPHGEYFYGLNADCISSAKAEGWQKMLDKPRKIGDSLGNNRDYKTTHNRAQRNLNIHKALFEDLLAQGVERIQADNEAYKSLTSHDAKYQAVCKKLGYTPKRAKDRADMLQLRKNTEKQGGPFFMQVTEKDGTERVLPVGVLRAYDSTLGIIAILAGIYAWYLAHKAEQPNYSLETHSPKRRAH